ncbi:hypothetical protein LPUS_06929 [Lasallia pustulata]|nr:hypothetical protein LPUS_06929 [Lasallia pustulata]
MPSSRKKGRNRRHVGFSLGSFMEDEENASEGHIEIYTDSKDKLPELDESEDNPFYVKPGQASSVERPASRASKRRKVGTGINVDKEMEQAFKREDGMVYVFRGKKIFRKFDDHREDEEADVNFFGSDEWHDSEIDGESSPPLRPFTRSSIKPRLLFPTEEQRRAREAQAKIAAEEAITDIEEHHLIDSEMTDLAGDTEEEVAVTPVKPTFILASPPTSGRTTRAAAKKAALDSSPLVPEPVELPNSVVQKVKKRSPFDMWQRTKVGADAAGKGRKREGDVLERTGGMQVKKAKSNGV